MSENMLAKPSGGTSRSRGTEPPSRTAGPAPAVTRPPAAAAGDRSTRYQGGISVAAALGGTLLAARSARP